MPIDENIKRNIRDLYFDQHKTIRELAKITRKSSRDIIAELKVSENKEKAEENKNIHGNIIFQHQNKKKETHNMTRLPGKVSCRVW
jgi:hypothetical protein